MKMPRVSRQTFLFLERFLDRPSAWRYGYELSRETGLKSGTLYPILIRLAEYSLLETKWVTTEDGVPPRHTCRLTSKGMELARCSLSFAQNHTSTCVRWGQGVTSHLRRVDASLLRFACVQRHQPECVFTKFDQTDETRKPNAGHRRSGCSTTRTLSD
jgi:DNA-binding PadR family transcriptional regulator